MINILLWFLITIIIATIAALLGKKYGVEYLIAMFVASIVINVVIAGKIVAIGPFTISAALVVYSITFLLTDTISEFWGKKEAKKAVWSGFLALIMLVFVTQIAINLTPASFWDGQEAFVKIFSSTWRIALASFLAYILAQNHDVWAYHFWKKKTKGKYLWLRNNASTWVSQSIDTVVFMAVAFYGVIPIFSLIISTIFLKVIVATLDTPFLYFIRWYYEEKNPKWKGKPIPINVPIS